MIPGCTFRSPPFSSAPDQTETLEKPILLVNVLKYDLDIRLGLAQKMCGGRLKKNPISLCSLLRDSNQVKGGH